ncbi:MAG: UPF0104 family protein [Cyanobacteria bacterium]|nr:UPF0104 family protein [Cyanobacteriota bacterium]MDA0865892.1 UPF0104 family protein [Cyanobacteriota bacterium]
MSNPQFNLNTLKKHFKNYFRWVILTFTLVFIAQTLKIHWQEVLTLQITAKAWRILPIALGVTLLAHIWSGWVWGWIIQLFGQPTDRVWVISTYLKTNIAKYLPGNVWHFVGRVRAVQGQGASTGIAVMSVVLEPLLMAAAALILASLSSPESLSLQLIALASVLVGIHPRILNPILRSLSRAKVSAATPLANQAKGSNQAKGVDIIKTYPLLPLLGEIIFVLGRGFGFILVVGSLTPERALDYWQVIGQFSLAWLMGLIIPGAPGGLGVFEATALTLMTPTLPTATVIGSVAIYRLVSTLAEALGAAMIGLDGLWDSKTDSA